MNVDDLRSVLRTERQKDSLQHLRESFYDDVAEYIAEQKAIRNQKAEELGTHYSPEIRRITDEIETAEEVVTSIYERRVGKVVKAASFAAAGMSSETEGLTHEEKRLFDDLVARIEQNRSTVLSTLEDVVANDGPKDAVTAGSVSTDEPTARQVEPEASETPSSDPTIPPDEPDPGTMAFDGSDTDGTGDAGDVLADAMGTGSSDSAATADEHVAAPDDESGIDRPSDEAAAVIGGDESTAETPSESGLETVEPAANTTVDSDTTAESDDDPLSGLVDDRETVRITADVGTIFGVDEREYDLAREDVVTLPSANAEPLVERGAAEKLE
ncbi:DNA replication protein [Haloferax sp. MBLA0076]|uniref:DNA replication protein n=1 Tax=Haloferax litoreum TaxID=2666140 RepID=A0A6A8GHJ3_9EURY|nr:MULTISPECIES: DNA replication complex GINS family protein [Haloferax]KAB1193833.1 DNA replication complex GINS family protein [Haloferax sp. CBA1148]MRX22376.1 DNA replication protein [Haloferax litoreum]